MLKCNEAGSCLTCINDKLRNMWLKIFVALNFLVLPNSISCQPVTDNIRDTRQTNFEECCPCSGDDGTDFRDEDMSPSSPMGSLAQGPDDCPCRVSGTDSQGSSSIFRPFMLKASHPSEREQQPKQGLKPLLQPEVGLASSVLETIQKATDEEYQEALARDAARNVLEIESGFQDSEPGNSRNSVTIVLNGRDDSYDGDDTMPEASHAHETRCIHSPLGRSSLVSNDMSPRMTKTNLLLKRKPVGYSFKSLFDMDNSASNIKETYNANNNELSTKLRMNPSLLNIIPTGEKNSNDPVSRDKFYELRTIKEYCNDLNNNELNSPKFRLSALRDRVRELVEQRNTKRLNNVPAILRQNNFDIFNNGGTDPVISAANSPFDAIFDRQSPALKNILKLKDVELVPPVKTINKDLTKEKYKLSDLKFAGSENDVTLSNINKDKSEEREEYDIKNFGNSEEYVSKEQIASEEESITSTPNNSDGMPTNLDKDIELKDLKDTSEMPKLLDDCLKLATKYQDVVNKSDEAEIVNDSSEYDSKEVDEESEMEDSLAEMSANVKEQLSEKDIFDSSKIQQNSPENNDGGDSLLEQNDGLTTFKNDILRKLENIKKSIKSKLQDTNTEKITKPIVSQPVYEKTTRNQDTDNSDLNSEDNPNMITTHNPQLANEKDVTVQDIQNLSDSLLKIESEDETKFDKNNKNEEYRTSTNMTDDNRSVSLELDPADTEVDENQASSEDENDQVFKESNTPDKQEDSNSDNSVISNENDDSNLDNTLPKGSASNDMSFQASNSKYNAISSPVNDNSPTLQDTFNLFKTPLQIPSLEDIRQGITDIIDAGQQESEDLEQDFDPLNQSSNRNSVLSNPLRSNLPTFNNLGKPLTDRYIRPFQIGGNNIEGYKSVFDNVSLKPLITQPFYPSTMPSLLGSNVPKTAINKKLKSSPDTTSIPSLDDIRSFFETQNYLKQPKSQLARTNVIENPILRAQKINTFADDLKYRFDNSLKPESKQAKQVNQILSKPRLDTNDFLESMSRKHEDMKEKLQALHLDFNDRVASIYKRINDQRKLQPVNIPTFREHGKSLSLPKSASKKEKNDQIYPSRLGNMVNNFPSQPRILKDETPMKKKLTPKLNSSPLKIPLGNNNFNKMKTNRVPLTEKEKVPVNNFPNLSEIRKYDTNNKKSFKPISKVKISFTTTTKKPTLASSKLQKSPDLIKFPNGVSGKERTADFNKNLKDITESLRSRLRPGDSSHAPSELIETEKLNDVLTNSQFDKHPRTFDNKAESEGNPINLETTDNSLPKKKESKFISNLREALRARLDNITKNAMSTTPKTKDPVEANLKELDTIVSPSEVKTVLNNPLIENTSYKCTMVCSKDQ